MIEDPRVRQPRLGAMRGRLLSRRERSLTPQVRRRSIRERNQSHRVNWSVLAPIEIPGAWPSRVQESTVALEQHVFQRNTHRLLRDMHIPDWDPRFLSDYDPGRPAARCAEAGLQ